LGRQRAVVTPLYHRSLEYVESDHDDNHYKHKNRSASPVEEARHFSIRLNHHEVQIWRCKHNCRTKVCKCNSENQQRGRRNTGESKGESRGQETCKAPCAKTLGGVFNGAICNPEGSDHWPQHERKKEENHDEGDPGHRVDIEWRPLTAELLP